MTTTFSRMEATVFSEHNEARYFADKCNKDNIVPDRGYPWQVMNSNQYYVVVCLSKGPEGVEILTFLKF